MNKIVITKRIAKQGKNLIIIVPSYLRGMLKAGSLVNVEIKPLKIESNREVS